MGAAAREVLIVEDEDNLRSLFASSLTLAGYTVSEVRLAAEAVPALKRKIPDLILLDAVMPPGQMSGMELLARLRENETWAKIPVVVVSGIGDLINRDAAIRLGVRTVLSKPIAMAELERTIRSILESPAPGT
jgi:DNA-binding response OmpR family regulator